MAEVLVQLPDGEGVVRREDGEIVVAQSIESDRGQPVRASDRCRPVKTWLNDDRSLVGGLLPPGAVSAEVVDDWGVRVVTVIGAGAYAAILEQPNDGHEPIVCCRDIGGTPVRRPLPDEYPSTPVVDAEEPCPACGAVDYEECVPTEDWRGGRGGPNGAIIPSPIVICRRCGHDEEEGVLVRFGAPDDEDDRSRVERLAPWRAEWRIQRWYENKLTLRGVTFPIYAAEGWAVQISGSGSRRDALTELTIAHSETADADLLDERSRIEVTTSADEPYRDELAIAREKLEHWIHDEVDHHRSPDLSDAAMTLWFRFGNRRRRAAALAATRGDARIPIDGCRESFLTLTTPSGRWVAVRRHHNLTVTIAARDIDPGTISLEPIADPFARLLGPEPETT